MLSNVPEPLNLHGSAGRGPVYRASLKDADGFPTVVVAGPAPQRGRVWMYVHGSPPTVLRLHPSVVRFLHGALAEVAHWLDQSEIERIPLVWTLPRANEYPECVMVASHQRAWLHVLAATPSRVRLNPRTADFLLDALADLPTWSDNSERAHRWAATTADTAAKQPIYDPTQVPVWTDELAGAVPSARLGTMVAR